MSKQRQYVGPTDTRDIFDKALDVVVPVGAGLGTGFVAGLPAMIVGGRRAARARTIEAGDAIMDRAVTSAAKHSMFGGAVGGATGAYARAASQGFEKQKGKKRK